MEKSKATKYMATSQVEHWVLSSSDFVSNLCLCLFHHFAPLSCLYLPGKLSKKLLFVVFGKRLLLASRHLMLYSYCCSALCLSYQSGSIADAPPPPELPEINGHCEQNRAIPRENAPEENICQSFGAKSNCDSRRPRFAPYPQLGLTSRLCQSFASKFDFKAILKQRICLSIRPPLSSQCWKSNFFSNFEPAFKLARASHCQEEWSCPPHLAATKFICHIPI